ncbi:TPA: ThiF family adenylyltransferase [Streptococcus pneumoniae]|nr:ThiF family adenylyltransferase [Streptococcus pneumoniae]
MYSVFDILESKNQFIKDGILYINDKAAGIISPTLVEGFVNNIPKKLFGPKGIVDIAQNREEEIWKALIDTGSIIFGSNEQEVLTAKKNLENPIYSRTFSYLSTLVKNCKELNQSLNNISNAKVVIIGCGGIGSMSAILLAGAGVKNLTLIDGDRIEESNLNRQILWTKADIGKFKVDILKRCIIERFDNIKVNLLNNKISEDLKLDDNFDIVIVTADEPLSLYKKISENNSHIHPYKIIGSGYIHSQLTLTVGNLDKSNNIEENFNWYRNPFFIGPSFGPSNIELAGVITSYALTQIAIKSNLSSFSTLWDSKKFPREIINV